VGLPVIAWPIAPAGAALVGRCLDHDMTQRNADFDVWARSLDAVHAPEHTSASAIYLRAQAQHYDGLVTVTILATIDDPEI
jgi:hypothetical protein